MSVVVPTMRAAPHGPARIYLGNLAEWYDFATFGASAALLGVVVTAGRGGLTSVLVVLAGEAAAKKFSARRIRSAILPVKPNSTT